MHAHYRPDDLIDDEIEGYPVKVHRPGGAGGTAEEAWVLFPTCLSDKSRKTARRRIAKKLNLPSNYVYAYIKRSDFFE